MDLAGLDLLSASHSGEWIAGIAGAGGAILGSAVSVIWTEFFNARTRRRDDRIKDRASAFSAFMKLQRIYSVALRTRDHLRQGLADAKKKPGPFATASVKAMNRQSSPIEFTTGELWVFAKVGSPLVNNAATLDAGFNSILELMDRYDRYRRELLLKIPAEKQVAEHTAQVGLDDAQYLEHLPAHLELDALLKGLLELSEGVLNRCYDATKLFVASPLNLLGEKFSAELVAPDGTKVKLLAPGPARRQWFKRKKA